MLSRRPNAGAFWLAHGVQLEFLLGQFFNGAQQSLIVLCDQGQRASARTGATGAANAMHVVFGVVRQVKIDHARHVGNVQAPRSDVGGD